MHKMYMYIIHMQYHIIIYGNILYFCFMCVFCLCIFFCAPHVCLVSAETRRGNQADPLDPTDGCVDSENQTWVLWKNIQCS